MEEKRNKFKVLVINEATGMRMEMPVSKIMADRVLKEIVNYETTGKNNNSNNYTPSPQQVERDVQETARRHFPEELIEEEFPEPTGRQEPIEKKYLPKERILAKRIAKGKYSDIQMVDNVIKTVKDVISYRTDGGMKKMRERILIKLILQKHRKLPESTCYSIVTPLIKEMGYNIRRVGTQNMIYFEKMPKRGVKSVRTGEWSPKEEIGTIRNKYVPINFIRVAKAVMNEFSEVRTKSIRVDTLLKAVVKRYGTRAISGNYYSVINNLAKEMGYSIIKMGKHNRLYFNGVPKTEVFEQIRKERGKRKKFISKKLLKLSKEGKRKIRVDKFIKLAGFNYSTGQLRELIYKEASELGFEIIKRGKKPVLIILSKKEGKPEGVWKREWKKMAIEDKIRDKLSELSEKGRKKIRMADLLKSIKVNRSGTTYLLLDKIISNMGFQTIRDRSKGGKRKIIILKKGFKPSPSVKYSDKERKIRNKLSELSGNGKREVLEGKLLKSLGLTRSGYMYGLLDNIAKNMGFEVIKLGKSRSFRKKIILKKEEAKGSRAFMSIYAKTLNEWEKIPTPFNLRQATFKLFGMMGGYNYNLTSMNVGQALNKLVREGKLVRKKVLATVQVGGRKGWKKEMWFYDLPKEGEEPQEVAPEPQEDVDLPVVSEDTLIAVFNQHIEISPKTFCGFYTKTGQPITERQARFLFYWMKDNLSFVQGLTGKKITIGGFGQWQTIKIR